LRGAALAAATVPGLRFVFAGKQANNQSPLDAVLRSAGRELPIEVTGTVSDERLLELYRGAIAVLCPSIYEGFGLTGLEAMACGTPVIHSGKASLAEVLGEAGLVAAAESPEEWMRAITSIAGDSRARQELVKRGRERAAHFTLERMIDATVRVYEQAFWLASGRTSELEAIG
jgi:glycosyltransferase involved in cell wall biosynthesis